jgi:hypothetical protein
MAEEIGTTAPWSHQTIPTRTNMRDVFMLPTEGGNEHNTALAKAIQVHDEMGWPAEVDVFHHTIELMYAPMFYLKVHELTGGIPDDQITNFAAMFYMAGKISEGWLQKVEERGDRRKPCEDFEPAE